MEAKPIGIILVVFGSLVLFSEQETAWIISAIAIGIGTGLYFFFPEKNNNAKK